MMGGGRWHAIVAVARNSRGGCPLPCGKLGLVDMGYFTWKDAGDVYAEIARAW